MPATATIRSPARSPASWAGLRDPWFSGTVRSIVVVARPVPMPMATSTIQVSRMATMKWVNDPAASTIARCQAGLLRDGSVGVEGGLGGAATAPPASPSPAAGCRLAERSSSRKLPSLS